MANTTQDAKHFINEFNRGLKILTRDLAKKYPNDATIGRAQKRVATAVSAMPVYVIDTAGAYLYKYRTHIYNLDIVAEKFFMESTFQDDLDECDDAENADLVAYIIPRAKQHAMSLPPESRDEYGEIIRNLLDNYIEYKALTIRA
jgi:hypothetical protein